MDPKFDYDTETLPAMPLLNRANAPQFVVPLGWLSQSMYSTCLQLENALNVRFVDGLLRCLGRLPWENIADCVLPPVDGRRPDPRPGLVGSEPGDKGSWLDRLAMAIARVIAGNSPTAGMGRAIVAIGNCVDRPAPDADHDVPAYRRLFQTIPIPPCAACVDAPEFDDAWFDVEPLQGSNPLVMAALEEASIPQAFLEAVEAFKAASGCEAPRWFWCDYQTILPICSDANRRVYPAQVLYAEYDACDAPQFCAVAIRPDMRDDLVISRGDAAWRHAKFIARTANHVHFVLHSHMPRHHFRVEAMGVSVARCLSAGHKIRILLDQHFDATFGFNSMAIEAATQDTGWLKDLMAGTTAQRMRIMASECSRLRFSDYGLQGDLQRRGVAQSPARYPYRDVGQHYWNAIATWTRDYVAVCYQDDATVAADAELQQWVLDLGCQAGFNDVPPLTPADGKARLADILQVIIWSTSAGHAAVQNGLADPNTFGPAAPCFLLSDPPKSRADSTPPVLPSARGVGRYQLWNNFFGPTRINRLQAYDLRRLEDPRVLPPLWKFQGAIKNVGKLVDTYNCGHRFPYDALHPDRVPRSVHA